MACYKSTGQSGIALLSAILVVLVASAIIVSITHQEAFSIRKTSRIQLMDKARLYALGLEDWARLFLAKDRKESSIDHLGEDWATGIPGLPIEGGFLSGYLEDEQGKFNLNNLLGSEESLNRFNRLCNNLNVDTTFVPALLDWLDEDFEVRYPDGAEENYQTYRVANREMVDISELLLVKNVTPEIYQLLKPHITVLPGATSMNVNTMSETIFLSLGDNLDADAFIEAREEEEFSDLQQMTERLQIPLEEAGLSVSTDYFSAHGQVTLGDQSLLFNTLIHRDSAGKTVILSRTLGQS
ncbi:MAG: type II secretion system minor pseudopilin GspK [Proteobacteria bacterium]|nr:type II secretion system minor pseudopilin GspK [Pseudomonadota bacterium]